MENITFGNNSVPKVLNENGISEGVKYLFICSMVVIALAGIAGNAVVIAVQIRLRVKSSTDYYILTMAIFDFFSATVNTTVYIVRVQPNLWKILASDVLCRLTYFSIYVTNISTTLLLAILAYTRVGRATATSTTESPVAVTRARRISIVIVVASCVYGACFLFTTTFNSTSNKCSSIEEYTQFENVLSGCLALVFMCMFVIVAVCYIRIAVVIWRHKNKLIATKLNSTSTQKSKRCIKKSQVQPQTNDEIMPYNDCMPSTSNENAARISVCTSQPNNCKSSETLETNSPRRQKETVTAFTRISIKIVENDQRGRMCDKPVLCNIPNKSGERHAARHNETTPSKQALSDFERNRKVLNHATLMMFLITVIYVSTWIVNWSASLYRMYASENGVVFLAERIFMINCVTNPIFYVIMSSKFRKHAKELFFCQPYT